MDTANVLGGAGWGKKEGCGEGGIMQGWLRACFALRHAIPTAHLGAGVGGGSSHNGTVSYPMRPVQ